MADRAAPAGSLDDLLAARARADPGMVADPYPALARLRTEDPIHWRPTADGGGVWILTGYAAIAALLRDPRLSSDWPHSARMVQGIATAPEPLRTTLAALTRFDALQMLNTDPPAHTRLRALAAKVFTPRLVARMRGQIQRLVDDLLDGVQGAGTMDVIRDVAERMPVAVIVALLGLPAADIPLFRRWGMVFAAYTDAPRDPAAIAGRQTSIGELQRYVHEASTWRRAHPDDGLLSAFVHVAEGGDTLSEEEIAAMIDLLIFAGHETTINLIGNGMDALLRHPEQRALLDRQPALIESAVEEVLRYESPVQRTPGRVATEEIPLDGKRILAGQSLSFLLGAANRDPAQFARPDELDIARAPNRHLAFGLGPHFCLGAALARLEGQVAIGTMLRRFPAMAVATDTPDWRANMTFRGLERLPVTLA